MKPNIKKNDIFELLIEDMLPDGNGIAKKDGFVFTERPNHHYEIDEIEID